MRNVLRKISSFLGFKTNYHVCASYQQDSHVGFSIISLQLTVKPWLHSDNYTELVKCMNEQAIRPVSTPTITSITKLGI